jgi:threonine/homoserine/homoserine lactone efflux protein
VLLIILIKSLILGFIAAVPVGPIGALCIERTLNHGKRCGFISGLGAATADGLYSAVAIFSITTISSFVLNHQIAIRLVGGFVLLWMGIRAFRNINKEKEIRRKEGSIQQTSDYFSTLFLTLTNPTTIIAFGLLFGAFHFKFEGNIIGQAVAVAGVTIGSAFWWFALSSLVDHFVHKMKRFSVEAIQRFSAGFVIICAILVLASIVYKIH